MWFSKGLKVLHSKSSCYSDWHSQVGSEVLQKISVTEHNLLLYQAHLRWNEWQWKCVLWSNNSTLGGGLASNSTFQRWKRKVGWYGLCNTAHGGGGGVWRRNWCRLHRTFRGTYASIKTISSQELHVYFRRISVWLHKQSVCLTGLSAVQSRLPLKLSGASLKKIR